MEKICQTCKYFNCGKCTNKYLGIEVDTKKGYEIIEDGTLSEALAEGLNIRKLGQMIVNQMNKDKILMLKPDLRKLNTENIEQDIISYLSDVLYKPLENYYNGVNYGIEISNPSVFGCNLWE